MRRGNREPGGNGRGGGGEGRLDAFAAVDQSPRGPAGSLQGIVSDASTGNPIAGATVAAVGPINRTTTTNASGAYSFPVLSVGSYDVTASTFGFLTQAASGVVVNEDETTVQDFALQPAPSHPVSSHVFDDLGAPIANAQVTILDTPIPPATTDANGFYSFASVPEGTYTARAEADAGRCNVPQQELPLTVAGGPATLDFTLPKISDGFGYTCELIMPAYVEATNVLPLAGDNSSLEVTLPFPFPLYDQSQTTVFVRVDGFLNFFEAGGFSNSAIPRTTTPNGAIYPFWDDLNVDASASIRTEELGTAPDRRFVIEWRNVLINGTMLRLDLEAVLFENGDILFQYRNIDADGREQGNSATVGIENQVGTVAFQYAFNEAALTNETAILFQAGGGMSPTPTPTPTATPENTPTPDNTPTPTAMPQPDGTMHVGDLDGSSINDGSTWTAVVDILVVDNTGNPIAGATVSGAWSNGASGAASCTTGNDGRCSVSESGIAKRTGSVTFTVDNVTHATLTYDAGANGDPDGTSITVNK